MNQGRDNRHASETRQDHGRAYDTLPREEQMRRLKEIAGVFLKLGATAFGGPAAHVAMMDDEIVRRRKWLDKQRFLDLYGATNLIPGPNSTELAIHLGFERGGWRGLVIAGTCFIVPAMLIVLAFAAIYVRFGALPEVSGILYGIKPVIMAVIVQALIRLGQSAVKNIPTGVIGAAVIALSFLGFHELALLLAGGLAMMLIANRNRLPWGGPKSGIRLGMLAPFPVAAAGGTAAATASAAAATTAATTAADSTAATTSAAAATTAAAGSAAAGMGLLPLFLTFLKIGSVLYGSGYVLLAFLEADFVERTAILTSRQLLDAVSVGQFTPGPVFTTATFIGYLIQGTPGALLATIGIFLPAFILVGLLNPLVPRMRRSTWVSGLLDGVNVASWGLMAFVSWKLAVAAIIDLPTLALALLALLAVFKLKVNSAWLVLAGGVFGLVRTFLF